MNNGPLRRCKIVVDLVILTFHCSCSMCSCIQLIVYTCDVYVSVSGSILQLLYVGWSIWSFVSRNTREYSVHILFILISLSDSGSQ